MGTQGGQLHRARFMRPNSTPVEQGQCGFPVLLTLYLCKGCHLTKQMFLGSVFI